MILVDVHSHMDSEEFKQDLDFVIKKCKLEGVKAIISAGIDKNSNREVIELSKKYDLIKPSLGIYPQDALSRESNSVIEDDVDLEIKFIRKNKNKIIAIGEVGLDYSYENPDKKKQKEIFVKMIDLAKELDKPIIVHSRKAESEVIEILEEKKAKKVILHCFMGRKNLIEEGSKRGYYFSVPPNIVRSENFQNLVKLVNINQLLTETDSPYLGPIRGERNDPSNIPYAIKKISEIKGFDEEETANNIYLNYQRLFL